MIIKWGDPIDVTTLYEDVFAHGSPQQCIEELENLRIDPGVSIPNTQQNLEALIAANTEIQRITLIILKKLVDERFPKEISIAQMFAIRLMMASRSVIEDSHFDWMETMRTISEVNFPENAELAHSYGNMLWGTMVRQQSDRKQTVEKLRCLWQVRFPQDSNIQQLYEKALAFQIHEDTPPETEKSFTLTKEKWEEIEAKISTWKEELDAADPDLQRIQQTLRDVYADSNLLFETDTMIEEWFAGLCDFYTSLNKHQNQMKLVCLRSHEGRVYTTKIGEFQVIVWDQSYWDLFLAFCLTLEGLLQCKQELLYASMMDLFTGNTQVTCLLNLLVSSTCTFFGNRYNKMNPTFASCFVEIENTVCKDTQLRLNPQGARSPLADCGKLYALLHETIHVFTELKEDDHKAGYESFLNLIKLYIKITRQQNFVEQHGYTKQEYIDRLEKLLEEDGSWKAMRLELYNDFMAFYEMLVFQNYCTDKPKEGILIDTILGAKGFNLFHTYLYMIAHIIELGLVYKRQGLYGNALIDAVNREIKQNTDEVEFRHVLNRQLEHLFLQINAQKFGISQDLLNHSEMCVEPMIDIYQTSIREMACMMQRAITQEYFLP